MKTRIPMLVMGIALMVSACQKDEVLAPAPGKSGGLSFTAITDVTWMFQRDRDGDVLADRPAPWFLLSSRTSELNGFTACNEIMGRYTLAGERLAFTPIAQTRRYCADVADVEERFLAVLSTTDGYRLERGTLILMSGQRELAWFTKR